MSCRNEEKSKSPVQNKEPVSQDINDIDTAKLTPQEAFSTALSKDILNEDDEDLQIFLEEDIYPIVSSLNRVTIDKISNSIYILSYGDKNAEKYFLIHKFYNPLSDEIYYEKEELKSDAAKRILRIKTE